MLGWVPEVCRMCHSMGVLLSFHSHRPQAERRSSALGSLCEAAQMPLSRVILVGVLPVAKNNTSSSGSCQTGTGKMLLLTPSSSQGHGAQVRSPPPADDWVL